MRNRFVSNIIPQSQDASFNLQSLYERLPILPLEKTVEDTSKLVPDILKHVSIAKEKCTRDSTILTLDESAAIYLYTMPSSSVYKSLNIALRGENRQLLHPWLPFLKLLITALEKLPPFKDTIWRGVASDETSKFIGGSVYTWWGITSCSKSPNIAQKYIGESGTLFAIKTAHGKDVTMFSANRDEEEVILMPATRCLAKSQAAELLSRLYIIHLQEVYLQE